MLHLFIIEDRFQIEGRGCVLVPGLPTDAGSPNLRRGARIRLRTPTGSETDTFIKEFAMISYRQRPEKKCIPVLLPKDIMMEDIPVGTEVLLIEEQYDIISPQD